MSAARLAALLVVLGVPACLPRPPAGTGGASFLQISWDNYKERYIHASGYVLDAQITGGTLGLDAVALGALQHAFANLSPEIYATDGVAVPALRPAPTTARSSS